MTIAPLDPFSEVVDKRRRWTPEWYSWITQLASQATAQTASWIYLSDFGVSGDGSTDDTAAINAAFASLVGKSGTVVWDVGFCRVTDSIIVGQLDGSGVTSFINIYCPFGQILSGIKWFGSTSGEAMVFGKNKYSRVTGLGIFNQVSKGTTIGLVLGGDTSGSGNQTIACVFESCFFSGFDIGVQAGGHSGAASEITFNDCQFDNNNTGFTASDFNSLDFLFTQPSFSSNGIGLDTGACSGFVVIGGSASFSSVADFNIQSNSSQTYIGGGFRSEVATICVLGDGGSVVVDKVLAVSPPSPFNSISGSFESLIVRDCTLGGFIAPSIDTALIEVTGTLLERWDTTRKFPVTLPSSEQKLRMHVLFRNNVDTGAFPRRQIQDHQGIVGARSDGSTVFPFYEPVITAIPNDQSSTIDIGCYTLALSHVRHLGEGTIPGAVGSTAPTPGKNLRVQATFDTSNSFAFTFIRTLTVTGAGGPVVTATVGTFQQSDVGKYLKITGGADTGADWYGYITDFLTSTTCNVFPSSDSSPGGRYPSTSGVGKTASIGQNEPDAAYMVAGICGNANETFWVTAIASTGFTFNSSNATSEATVTALIVR